ncbi:MAG: O-antigen ligase family protein [Gaiellaceae bacterium]
MTAELARAGGVIGAAGLGLLLVAPRRDLRLAGLGALVLGCALLAWYLAPHGHAKELGAVAVLGLVLAAGVAAALRRWPWSLALLALACVPARIPVTVGSTNADLLIPLYGVVAGAAVLLAYELFRGDQRSKELGLVAWPLAAFVAWSGLTIVWTGDLRQGAIELLFFYLPFGLLAVALARLPWRPRLLTVLLGELVLMALAFAVVGVYQWSTRDVFWNPKVIVGNAYLPFYRVNSVFWDPSIYGRFLVVAMLASLVLVLFGRDRRWGYAAGVAIAATWIGLLFSFSQSSFVALVAGVFIAAAIAWRWQAVLAAVLVALVLGVVAIGVPQVRHSVLSHSRAGLNNASSGRYQLVSTGAKIAVHNGAVGVGIGSFKRAYAKRLHLKGKEPKKAASHDTPITVAAETGLPGLAFFVCLLAAALWVPFSRVRRSFEGSACLVFGLGLAAIAVHSLFYNAFFEDPMAWGLFGLSALVAGLPRREAELEPAIAQVPGADGRRPAAAAAQPADRTPAEAG